jgi:hypothetical protein
LGVRLKGRWRQRLKALGSCSLVNGHHVWA